MTRAALHLPSVLALLLSGAAATGFADARVLAGWNGWDASQVVPATASIDAPATPAGPALVSPPLATAVVARDANTGPTGRPGPNEGPGDTGPAGREVGSGQQLARTLQPIAGARGAYRGHYAANALTRTGFPSRSATAPPAFHSD